MTESAGFGKARKEPYRLPSRGMTGHADPSPSPRPLRFGFPHASAAGSAEPGALAPLSRHPAHADFRLAHRRQHPQRPQVRADRGAAHVQLGFLPRLLRVPGPAARQHLARQAHRLFLAARHPGAPVRRHAHRPRQRRKHRAHLRVGICAPRTHVDHHHARGNARQGARNGSSVSTTSPRKPACPSSPWRSTTRSARSSIMPPFTPTGDAAADLPKIKALYSAEHGKAPRRVSEHELRAPGPLGVRRRRPRARRATPSSRPPKRRARRSQPRTSTCCRWCRRISGSSTASSTSSWWRSCRSSGRILYSKSDRPSRDSLVGKLKRAAEKLNTRKLNAEIERLAPDVILCTHFLPAELLSRHAPSAEEQGQAPAAVVGAGHGLRRARAVGAPARGPLLRGERGGRVPARRSRRAARKDFRHRDSGDAAVQRAARARRVRAGARPRARKVHRVDDGRWRGGRQPR